MTGTVYVHVDCEYTGQTPDRGSLISLGALAYDEAMEPLAPPPGAGWEQHFYATLKQVRPGDADTMKWWEGEKKAWAHATQSPRSPFEVMAEFATWVEALPGRPLMVSWPAAADWPWVNAYLWKYAGRNPLGYKCLCIGTMAAVLLGDPATFAARRPDLPIPDAWCPPSDVPHHALYDAEAQARGFRAMLTEAARRAPA